MAAASFGKTFVLREPGIVGELEFSRVGHHGKTCFLVLILEYLEDFTNY